MYRRQSRLRTFSHPAPILLLSAIGISMRPSVCLIVEKFGFAAT
jgi:hypothetical protein